MEFIIDAAPITVSPNPLPHGTVGVEYHVQLVAAGGVAPYNFSVSGGSLPPGLSLSQSGVLSGVPTTAGDFTEDSIRVGDDAGNSATF